MGRRSDEQYRAAIPHRYADREQLAAVWSARVQERRCMICGAESGEEPTLPAGWSFARWSEKFAGQVGNPQATASVAAFFCDRCTAHLGLREDRNYGEDVN